VQADRPKAMPSKTNIDPSIVIFISPYHDQQPE
jgi:hypothetical protein